MSLKLSCIQENICLAPYTSWKVGGMSEFFCQPQSIAQFKEVVDWALENKQLITILGGGTNVLISDAGIKGLVVSTKNLIGIDENIVGDDYVLSVMSGTPKFEVMRYYLKKSLSPALFLTGLPGNTGGGVVMNAGVREELVPREFVEIIEWVDVLKWSKNEKSHIKRYRKSDLRWQYRDCSGWQPGIIVRVGLKWPNKPRDEIKKLVFEANKKRMSKQPLDKPSCGSVFRNPEGFSSGALIEDCGLKGYSIGGAKVSKKHANFIINTGEASAQNIADLIDYVCKTIKEKKGITLESEVVLMGF